MVHDSISETPIPTLRDTRSSDLVYSLPSVKVFSPTSVELERTEHVAMEVGTAWSQPHFLYSPLKRACDIILALVILVPLLIILVPIAILLLIEDGGPPIYRGEVVGLNGRRFKMYKIRTMRRDADAFLDQHPTVKAAFLQDFKLADDPRVLKLGKFLRKTSIDELPQTINVLLGEMSWVGPRPVKEEELERYGTFASLRLTMKPGITGLWQISGRSDLPYPLRTIYDRTYYYTRSTWTDLKVIWLTIPTVLRRDGAV